MLSVQVCQENAPGIPFKQDVQLAVDAWKEHYTDLRSKRLSPGSGLLLELWHLLQQPGGLWVSSSSFPPEHAGICSSAPWKTYGAVCVKDCVPQSFALFLKLLFIGSLPLPIGKQGRERNGQPVCLSVCKQSGVPGGQGQSLSDNPYEDHDKGLARC